MMVGGKCNRWDEFKPYRAGFPIGHENRPGAAKRGRWRVRLWSFIQVRRDRQSRKTSVSNRSSSGVQTMKKILFSALVTSLAIGFSAIVPVSAMTHDQICAANRDQCLKGCDGMAQCSNACQINYEKCLQGGQQASAFERALQSSHTLVADIGRAACQPEPSGNAMSAGAWQTPPSRAARIRTPAGSR